MRLATDLKTRPRLGEVAAIWYLLNTVNQEFALLSEQAVITSGMDGKHMQGSLHYIGRAFDFRTRTLSPQKKQAILTNIKSLLGQDYDVVDEGDHLHVEWDPKP